MFTHEINEIKSPTKIYDFTVCIMTSHLMNNNFEQISGYECQSKKNILHQRHNNTNVRRKRANEGEITLN